MVICSFTLIFSIRKFSKQLSREYVNVLQYPVDATEWILGNDDYKNMRIWTHFNWGSYLELKGIKVFIDSRSGMYTEEENKGCTVLADWLSINNGKGDYEKIFEKYNITHVLLSDDDFIKKYISKDENYKLIYEDSLYSLYERK